MLHVKMDEPAPPKPAASRFSWTRWLGALIPLVLIAAGAIGYILFRGTDTPDHAPPPPANLAPNSAYYLSVHHLELYPQRIGGGAWDRLDSSGPDVIYELIWQGNSVFTSSKKSDTLIASWDALSVDLKSAILSGQVDLGSSIQAAIVRPAASPAVTLSVWDADLADKDPAGTIELDLNTLVLGDNELTFTASDQNAIKSVTIRLIDQSLPVAELVEAASKP